MNYLNLRNRRVSHAFVVAALVGITFAGAACSSSPPSHTAPPTTRPHTSLTVKGSHFTGLSLYGWPTSFGQVVGWAYGLPLYVDTQDSAGSFDCTGACLRTWQPVQSFGDPVHAGPGVDQGLIGTVARAGGIDQITYAGHPLYLYTVHVRGDLVNGEGVEGKWYAISPSGTVYH